MRPTSKSARSRSREQARIAAQSVWGNRAWWSPRKSWYADRAPQRRRLNLRGLRTTGEYSADDTVSTGMTLIRSAGAQFALMGTFTLSNSAAPIRYAVETTMNQYLLI